jgi:pimeloyl-ACP methyl ester carboxylesterase
MPVATALQQIVVSGKPVPYLRLGAGEPLLYLHGVLGDVFSVDGDLLPFHLRLAQGFEVIAPAHPGFADAAPLLEAVDSIEDLVFHYLDLLEALGLPQVHLVGHSLGGWIAAELAVRCAHRLKTLTLIAACGLTVPGHPTGNFFHAAAPRPAGDRQLLRELLCASSGDGLSEKLLPDQAGDQHRVLIYRALVTAARVGWSPPYLRSLTLARRLGRIPVPTLVVWGDGDRLVPPAHAEAYRAGIPGARAVTIPGGGHCIVAQRPEETAQAVLTFLGSVKRS